MTLKAAFHSVFATISGAFISRHDWQHNEGIGLRSCSVCGRKEELDVDLMSTSWEVVELGDASAHTVKSDAPRPVVAGNDSHALARQEQPSPLSGTGQHGIAG